MKLTKIVFNGQVHGLFGESVSSLGTEPSPTVRSVEALEMTPLGLIVTKMDGKRHLVPVHACGTGDLPEEPAREKTPAESEAAAAPRGPKAKAR